MRRLLTLIAVAAVLGGVPAALAQNKAAADSLFKEGKKLFDRGETSAACAKFEASLKLMDQLGVRLNLGACYQKLGKLAAAYEAFRAAEVTAQRTGDPRASFARQRLEAVQKEMPLLTIKLASGADLPGLEIKHNGQPIDRAMLNTPLPVDPGEQTVEATAPGRLRFSTWVEAVERSRPIVEIPVLKPDPAAARRPTGPGRPKPKPRERVEGDDDDDDDDDVPVDRPGGGRGRSRRMIGIGVGVAGLAALGTGAYFGFQASSKWSDARADGHCDDDGVCDDIGYPLARDARRAATVSTVLVGAGVVAVGAGVILYLTAPSGRPAEDGTARLSPVLMPGGAGLAVAGRF